MDSFIDITQNILSQNTICFETRFIDNKYINVPIDGANFGILEFKAVTASETNDTIEFIFVVDCSGSMSDRCADGRSKMQHITHTLKNMILFFNNHPNINLFITINAFDTQIYKIVERTNITKDNSVEILKKIDDITPLGSTNIELALLDSARNIEQIKNLYPTHKINHIFMTDGEANDGSTDIHELQGHIINNVTNIFIGFGIDHDATLLNGISSVGKGAYYFIDKLESSGLVYGEILHSIIYKLLTDPEITITNGLIYDYKNNSWVEKLRICDIISESNKIFNIASNNPDECKVEIKASLCPWLNTIFPSTRIENTDLTCHLYRQRTLQILFEVNEFFKKTRENRLMDNDIFSLINRRNRNRENDSLYDEKNDIKMRLFNFITEMKNYISDNNLENNKILKNLCDDIYVCYRTFDTKYGDMFCTARQTSQGTQRIYTVSNTDDIDINGNDIYSSYDNNNLSIFNRQLNVTNHGLDLPFDDNLLNILNHEVSNFEDTPYLTPQATNVIMSINTYTDDYDTNYKDINYFNNDDDECSQATFNLF